MSEYTAIQSIKWKPAEKRLVEKAAQLEGFDSTSAWCRQVLLAEARKTFQGWLEKAGEAERDNLPTEVTQ